MRILLICRLATIIDVASNTCTPLVQIHEVNAARCYLQEPNVIIDQIALTQLLEKFKT